MQTTPIQFIDYLHNNKLFIKRDDLIPFSFGGNKARKAELFFKEIDNGKYDCVVTYGSSSSNHCRIVSNAACKRGIDCYIISPEESSESTFNSQLMTIFGAKITIVPVSMVHDTIESIVEELKLSGKNPYFIPGGGHGNIGTQAYVNCYDEIREYEKNNQVQFDYIFLASGTGTTQAGLVCGQIIHNDFRNIIGISIARKSPKGRQVIIDSVIDYLSESTVKFDEGLINKHTIFVDSYVGQGYGQGSSSQYIDFVLKSYGIPLDSTYTGKAFEGMNDYIISNGIKGKNILFIHTGGTPLFFDYLLKRNENK